MTDPKKSKQNKDIDEIPKVITTTKVKYIPSQKGAGRSLDSNPRPHQIRKAYQRHETLREA